MVLGSTNKAHESHIDKAMPLYSMKPFISIFVLAIPCPAHMTECRGARARRGTARRAPRGINVTALRPRSAHAAAAGGIAWDSHSWLISANQVNS